MTFETWLEKHKGDEFLDIKDCSKQLGTKTWGEAMELVALFADLKSHTLKYKGVRKDGSLLSTFHDDPMSVEEEADDITVVYVPL